MVFETCVTGLVVEARISSHQPQVSAWARLESELGKNLPKVKVVNTELAVLDLNVPV